MGQLFFIWESNIVGVWTLHLLRTINVWSNVIIKISQVLITRKNRYGNKPITIIDITISINE